ITNNSAGALGGGLYFQQGSKPTILNCTIANNSAPTGAGIFSGGSIVTISNSIIWNNTPTQIFSNSIIISYSDIQGGQEGINGSVNWLEGNIDTDPLFVDPDAGDYSLQGESPCIDAGNPNTLFNDRDGSRNDMGFTGGGWLQPSFVSYDFEEIGVSEAGITNKETEWTLYNADDEPVEITSASFSTEHFTLVDAVFPAIITPYSGKTFKVRFQPRNVGTFSDSLTLSITGIGSAGIEFHGQGISSSTIYGEVTGQFTREGSPYVVIDHIQVPNGDSLIIDPGVELRFNGHYKFNVFGLLKAMGTEQDSIIFTRHEATESSKWGGIRFRGADYGSEMAYCKIEYAKADESGWSYDVYGGGLYIGSSAIKISHCEISNNESRYGGGITILGGGRATIIEDCLITENVGDWGGGIYLWSASPSINNTLISKNSASNGAGIYMDGSSPDIQGTVIMNNDASTGGGIYIEDDYDFPSLPILQNCLIAKNSANSRGGAIYCIGDSSKPVFINCTITGNYLKWDDDGGGIYSVFDSNILLVNTILYNNTPNEIFLHEEYPSSVTIGYSNIEGGLAGIAGNANNVNWLEGNLDNDPLFADTANAVYTLNIGSPSIDAGTSLFVWEGDTIINLGSNDYFSTAPDMGAYETYLTTIYAGDTDNNGIVDAMDILPIGVYFQQIGSPRINDGVNWEDLSAVVWNEPAATYADANGDGTIDERDVIAIGVNWGNTHQTSSPGYAISLTDTVRLQEHQDSFMEIYNSLSGESEAVRAMKTLLRTILDIQVPLTYSLSQNYPNPFNPRTTIRFGLPEPKQVTLTVYNLLGKEVTVLVNNKLYDAGMHKVVLDAGRFSSGVYFYRIHTGKWSKTRKMLVIK
ncbi:MAG: T9SS type A sorting domain-containing protein, partial [Candidatus Marinimicrobia bacterium]|nr:T9SS type A sorting domain-containing protein [Candidatus Neomarinimicrobiota bacterium]